MLKSSISRAVGHRSLSCISSSLYSSHTSHLSTARAPPHPRQRRFSSSKASNSPKDDSSPITAPTDARTQDAARASNATLRKRPATRLTRQKLKEASPKAMETTTDNALSQLPSVPSTNHLNPHEIHMASFFSLYRPISVTTAVPPYSSHATFSSIFTPRVVQNPRPAEVIYTLSVAVNALEKTASQAEQESQIGLKTSSASSASQIEPLRQENLRAAVTQASTSNAEPTNLDGQSPQIIHVNIEELARSFQPFQPPPAPVPLESPAEEVSQTYVQLVRVARPQQNNFFTARLPFHRDPSYPSRPNYIQPRNSGRTPFLDRMRIRQERWEEDRADIRREMWRAISVKRQRKLKMKKHKYKKLMRATKNIRRRLNKS